MYVWPESTDSICQRGFYQQLKKSLLKAKKKKEEEEEEEKGKLASTMAPSLYKTKKSSDMSRRFRISKTGCMRKNRKGRISRLLTRRSLESLGKSSMIYMCGSLGRLLTKSDNLTSL